MTQQHAAPAMRWRREATGVPHDLTWRIALLFIVGSFLFALGSFPPYALAVDGRVVGITFVGVTFVVGSIFFTTAGYSALYQVMNDGRDADRPRTGTFIGAVGFLVGAYLLLPPAGADVAEPTPSTG